MAYAFAVVAALLVGFLAGLMTFKRSARWCPVCGSTLRCTQCVGHPTHFEAASRIRTGTNSSVTGEVTAGARAARGEAAGR
jgi:hypothetical protein